MRLIHLPLFWTLVLDCVAWAAIQPGIGYLSLQFPSRLLDHRRWLYRTRRWERDGALYQHLFRVRTWKGRLPSAGTLFQGFSMGQIRMRDEGYLQTWLAETCRAELCHWLAILPAFLFFLWNPVWLGVVMVAYAAAFNAVPIIAQRYNRPRLIAILRRAGPSPDSAPGAIIP